MQVYRWSTTLKLGLFLFALLIAVVSLWYTHRLVEQLRDREQAIVQLWTDAHAEVAQSNQLAGNPYEGELQRLAEMLRALQGDGSFEADEEELAQLQQAIAWARTMPPADELNFVTDKIIVPNPFDIPAIISDSMSGQPSFWRGIPGVPASFDGLNEAERERARRRLLNRRAEMSETYEPLAIRLEYETMPGEPPLRLVQLVHYDESLLVKRLRVFPYAQLGFVALFIMLGYLGFSTIRRSEQSSLWAGMAKEAAHQLGTPITSLMGWTELLRIPELGEQHRQEAVDEIEKDVERLKRVANRFGDIGSKPKLEVLPLAPLVEETAGYIRRRMSASRRVALEVDVPEELHAPLNAELLSWVVENLLKNALDAMEEPDGRITVTARRAGDHVEVDVEDTGKGIERGQWKNVFRPGYSTKQRGWGLGLSLARRIVEDYHQGTLRVADSKLGEGTTFRIELPTG